MSIPAISPIYPAALLDNIDPHAIGTPYTPLWWSQYYLTQIPETAIGWLAAQGWKVVGSPAYDDSTTPPTPYYNMQREVMNNWIILQTLLNQYTAAYNEGRSHNAQRYNDLVQIWNECIQRSEIHVNATGDNSDNHVTIYLASLTSLMDQVDTRIIESRDFATGTAVAVYSKLEDYIAKVAALETNYAAHAAAIGTILTDEDTNLASFLSTYGTELTALESEFTTHLAAVRALETTMGSQATGHIVSLEAQIAGLSTDFTTHDALARGYLTDLGVTELARINEKWDEALAAELQKLTDRGFYASQMATDITARNTRERSQQVTELNDRLNREKLDNEHKLFEQKAAMRGRTMEGLKIVYQVREVLNKWKADNEYKLEAELGAVRQHILAGEALKHSAQQAVAGAKVGQRDGLLARAQQSVGGMAEGYKGFGEMMLRRGDFLTQAYQRCMSAQLEVNVKRLAGRMDVRDKEESLMRWQLDARNGLVIGMCGQVERRIDAYPSMEELTRLVSSLGDSGSTSWVAP